MRFSRLFRLGFVSRMLLTMRRFLRRTCYRLVMLIINGAFQVPITLICTFNRKQ